MEVYLRRKRRHWAHNFTYDTLGSPVITRSIYAKDEPILTDWHRGWCEGWQVGHGARTYYDGKWQAGWKAGWQVATEWHTNAMAKKYARTTYV